MTLLVIPGSETWELQYWILVTVHLFFNQGQCLVAAEVVCGNCDGCDAVATLEFSGQATTYSPHFPDVATWHMQPSLEGCLFVN